MTNKIIKAGESFEVLAHQFSFKATRDNIMLTIINPKDRDSIYLKDSKGEIVHFNATEVHTITNIPFGTIFQATNSDLQICY